MYYLYNMKLVKTIYRDNQSNEWIIQKESLPKKRGSYVYWIAECNVLNKCYREMKKKDLKKSIENKNGL